MRSVSGMQMDIQYVASFKRFQISTKNPVAAFQRLFFSLLDCVKSSVKAEGN